MNHPLASGVDVKLSESQFPAAVRGRDESCQKLSRTEAFVTHGAINENVTAKLRRSCCGGGGAFCQRTYEVSAHLPWPTFMMTFIARLLHTPPSRFSRPSTVPLEVAGGGGEKKQRKRGGGGCVAEFRTKKREGGER